MSIRRFAFLLIHAASALARRTAPAASFVPSVAPSTFVSPSSSSRRVSKTSLSNSREQAEQYLYESYPKFYSILRENPDALRRMRESRSGFAVLAPSDAALESLGSEPLRLLEAACDDPDARQVVSRMAAYHVASAPATAEIMGTYGVVTTSVGELPVEVAPDGTMYVNGRRIIRSYHFEDRLVESYQDREGNSLGSQSVEGGRRCIVHEVDGLVCPDELWHALYSHFETTGLGAM